MSSGHAAAAAIGVSLVAFRSAEEVRSFDGELGRRLGREGLYELAYTTPAEVLEALRPALRGRVVSGHAPCPPSELFPNLGSRDPGVAAEGLRTVRRSAETAASFGARLLVLHPGYTTDAGVFADSRRRLEALERRRDPEDQAWLWLERGTVCRRGYCSSPHYRVHLSTAIGNLRKAAHVCAGQGVRLAAENLNPRLSYLFQLPEELVELSGQVPEIAFCVALGHLWSSRLGHGFPFIAGLRRILDTGRVASVHVHDNASTLGPPPVMGDDHALIGSGNVPLREALTVLAAAGAPRLIIESQEPALENYARLLQLIEAARCAAATSPRGSGSDPA